MFITFSRLIYPFLVTWELTVQLNVSVETGCIMKICMFQGSNLSFQEMEILSRSCVLILVFVLMLQCTAASLLQVPEPVSVLAPVGSFVEFTCTVNPSELPANTFFDPIRWRINNAILIRMGQAVSGNTITLEVTTSYISAAASVQCSTKLNGTIEVFSDMTATLTAYGIVQFAYFT